MACSVESLPDVYRRSRRPSAASSERTTTTWRYDVFGHPRPGKGNVLYTGPDGLSEFHRMRTYTDNRQIGIGPHSTEHTSELSYLWRPPKGMTFPRPKSAQAGAIGWGIGWGLEDWRSPVSGAQITLGPFRQSVEQRHTHLYQNAWYPGPGEDCSPGTEAAMVMNPYNRPYTAPPGGTNRSQSNGQISARNNTPGATPLYGPGKSPTTPIGRNRYNSTSSQASELSNVSSRSRGSTTIKYT